MKIRVLADADAVAKAGAAALAEAARAAVAARGVCTMALSGGRTPWVMLRALEAEDVPWQQVKIVQVDERVQGLHPADSETARFIASEAIAKQRAQERYATLKEQLVRAARISTD